MDNFNNFAKNIQDLKRSANEMMNKALTADVLAAMTPEERAVVSGSMVAFDLGGKTTIQKAKQINDLINTKCRF